MVVVMSVCVSFPRLLLHGRLSLNSLWIEARLSNGCQRLRQHILCCVDAKSTRTQLEVQGPDASDRVQRPSNVGFFGRAVHGRYTEPGHTRWKR